MRLINPRIQFKNREKNIPVLTIITVVRNSEKTIEKTILSVINQNYSNIEYIIIDGGSQDNTKEIIRKYERFIDYWVSEPDKGIYDAMNKGISIATGDWVNFMNAGDEFINFKVCKLIAEQIVSKNCNLIYGDFIAKDNKRNAEISIKAKPLNQIWKGMVFSHQSTFINLSNLKKTPFDLGYKICADYCQILSLYTKNNTFFYIPMVIAKVTIDGLSYSNTKTIIEQIKIVHSFKPYSYKLLFFIYPLIIGIIRTIVGEKATSKIREYKWQYLHSKG